MLEDSILQASRDSAPFHLGQEISKEALLASPIGHTFIRRLLDSWSLLGSFGDLLDIRTYEKAIRNRIGSFGNLLEPIRNILEHFRAY